MEDEVLVWELIVGRQEGRKGRNVPVVILDREEAMSKTKGFLLGRASISSICALVSGAFCGRACAGVLAMKGAKTFSAKKPRPASGKEVREKCRTSFLL